MMRVIVVLFSILFLTNLISEAASAQTNNTNNNSSRLTESQTQQIENIVHNYLIQHPEVLLESAHALQQKQNLQMRQQAEAQIQKNATVLFNSVETPVVGNPKGDLTVVEFIDFQCPYCKKMAPMIANLIQTDHNVRLILKQLPIFGEPSVFAARAALASEKQHKYFEFVNALMKTKTPLTNDATLATAKSVKLNVDQLQKDMDNSAITQEIKNTENLAEQLGLIGTPAFIIAKNPSSEGLFLPGALSQNSLEDAIQQVRKS